MFDGIFEIIKNILLPIVDNIIWLFNQLLANFGTNENILYETVNLSLFSDNVIFSIALVDLIILIIAIIFIVIIIKFLIKATKKFISMIFGVFRV